MAGEVRNIGTGLNIAEIQTNDQSQFNLLGLKTENNFFKPSATAFLEKNSFNRAAFFNAHWIKGTRSRQWLITAK